MWLVSTFRDVIYPQMKKEGLKLKPGEIYNEESPALCNAIVAVDGGMGTGSVISDKGLVITNHHVAYGDIHSLSTPAKNYLEEGFWALRQKDELPLKGKTVTFLRQVRDVTDEALAIRDSLEKANSLGVFGTRKVYGILERKYGKDTPFDVECASMWKGKKYLLFYYETYKDVRLVGAPPVKIGAFGGEQDNWGWPQHKGDFALYRVYGDAKGRPAAYAEDNVPITPRKVLNVSTSGIHDGDYAMVIGFPGRTNRYMSSFAVREKGARDQPRGDQGAPRPPRHHAAPHGGRPGRAADVQRQVFQHQQLRRLRQVGEHLPASLRRNRHPCRRGGAPRRLDRCRPGPQGRIRRPARQPQEGLRGPRRSRARKVLLPGDVDSPERRDDDGQPSPARSSTACGATASPRCRMATRTSRA